MNKLQRTEDKYMRQEEEKQRRFKQKEQRKINDIIMQKKFQSNYKNDYDQEKIKNRKLQDKMKQLNQQIDALYMQNQSESLLTLEIEKLKNDNIRLIQMLKTSMILK